MTRPEAPRGNGAYEIRHYKPCACPCRCGGHIIVIRRNNTITISHAPITGKIALRTGNPGEGQPNPTTAPNRPADHDAKKRGGN